MYATRENYTSLSLCDTIYIDGTFNTCREPYSQLVTYTTSRKHLGRVFTFYVSFHLKDHWAVQAAFQTRKRQIRQITGRHWRQAKVICNFKVALISALETELPHTKVCDCYFHFCQRLWRKIQFVYHDHTDEVEEYSDFLEKSWLSIICSLLFFGNFFCAKLDQIQQDNQQIWSCKSFSFFF